ncbi:exopolyphosphatase [Shewanella intestini]|uniref:Exopolyphosphatase n=1 Tax=Shewanella intestini TaxID=2017544 RepID=A0ABS5I0H5_9GAMM|nr:MULTISPECIES: exopolyphosphatase [Shewanella]MBR9727524.1 exopolyphosphatase [Shewanella intestini]MRG35326.1 exopolyphosphatase [Shewanella sp. XMDDZSB0408]
MSSELYAAITLGSNSFNMLVAQTQSGKPTIIAKYKRKVRLAEGIGSDGILSELVMVRGLECLTMFAQKLSEHQISSDNIAVLATATLRVINNADEFHRRALPILNHPIEVISGHREAELIYQGMTSTTAGDDQRLVIDIGGASTEFIIGVQDKLLFKTSVPIGGVLFNQQIFNQPCFSIAHFEQAKLTVEQALGSHLATIKEWGWTQTLGASGAVQSIIALLKHRQCELVITADVLLGLRDELLGQACGHEFEIAGLSDEQAPTFVAGVAILLALFELLEIHSLYLAGGALREGVLQMLANNLTAQH